MAFGGLLAYLTGKPFYPISIFTSMGIAMFSIGFVLYPYYEPRSLFNLILRTLRKIPIVRTTFVDIGRFVGISIFLLFGITVILVALKLLLGID